MAAERTCPACHSRVAVEETADGSRLTCPRCGLPLPALESPINPYEAPSASVAEAQDQPPEVPASFLGKLGLAARLYSRNLPLIAPLVLLIWLPANLFINYVTLQQPVNNPLRLMQFNNVVEGLLGPIYAGAILHVLARWMTGDSIKFFEALSLGMNNWGRLFGARFFAGFCIFVGLLAFIIPGVILAIRYAYLDSVVVLEHAPRARQRSSELVKGKGGEILGAFLLYLLVFTLLAIGLGSIPEFVPTLDTVAFRTSIDCVTDVLATFITVLMFVYYWEASGRELLQREEPAGEDHPEIKMPSAEL